MLCREVRRLMSSYLDGQLQEEQTRQIEEHIAGCDDCRGRLAVMHHIPVALQTDRMLAPRPEFTKLVMQRIIVQQQVGNTLLETRYSQVSVEYVSGSTVGREAETSADDAEPERSQAKIISLAERRLARPRTTSDLVLRMSAIAAALVLMVGAGIYIAALGPNSTSQAPTAAVYGAIKDFGDTLRNSLNSPVEVVVGIAIAALILIGLWYGLKTLRSQEGPARREQTKLES